MKRTKKPSIVLLSEDVIEDVYDKVKAGYEYDDVKLIAYNLFESMKEQLKTNELLIVENFGIFTRKDRKVKNTESTVEGVYFKMSKNFFKR